MSLNRVLLQHAGNGGTNEWVTPPEVFGPLHEEFQFGADLAAATGTERVPAYVRPETNSLKTSWHRFDIGGRPGWLNPPYSEDHAFMEKAVAEASLGFTTVALIFAKTDVRWWHQLVMRFASEVRLVEGRISFIAGCDIHDRKGQLTLRAGERGPATKGSAIVVFDPRVNVFGVNHVPKFSSWKQRK